MRDDAVRMLSGPNQREWLARNTRYDPETDRLLVWNIITWKWCLATSENILKLETRKNRVISGEVGWLDDV
ncbi:MAG: hypothetical protein LKE81_15640 [Acetobacter sp.]|nr:hypothetical protein [Acetobacter sp.]MCH4062814.1 hypothetical protein [Acetobacter sp.]MCH4088343.1 hypothetical protein [Acetobacter sp.]